MVDINTTPLIDVMLVLLIMLIITIPIQLHAVNLNMPAGNPPPPPVKPEVVQLDIDFDGTVVWNGEVQPTRAAMEAKMAAAVAQPVQPEVHIRPNKLVAYRVRRRGHGVGAADRPDQDRHRRQRAVHQLTSRRCAPSSPRGELSSRRSPDAAPTAFRRRCRSQPIARNP